MSGPSSSLACWGRPGSHVGHAIQGIQTLVPPAGERLLTGEDPERPVDGGEIGGEIRAGMPANRPVDQLADYLSPGDTLGLRDPVQRGGLALG
jgi:hypothetical protein